jgi:hypothetical protein
MRTMSTSKAHTRLLACAVAATALVSTSNAIGQSRELMVNVPFAFHNGSQRLPAGAYRVHIESERLILLRGPHGSGYVTVSPEISRTASRGKLVFHRYAGQYFLSEVWADGSNTGFHCTKSKQEKEAQIAANSTAPSAGAVALAQAGR